MNVHELDEKDQLRLKYILKNKIIYISGTMAPADQDIETNELESLKKGLHYFKRNGVSQVVLQPKYMGSRCTIYLSRNVNHCFAVSRNGYKIKHPDLTSIYEKLLMKFTSYMEEHKVKVLILDGELLPWSALGEGLIERQFKTIDVALRNEIEFLKEHGFGDAFEQLIQNYKSSGFEEDQKRVGKSELIKKYGDSVYQNYKDLHRLTKSFEPIDEHMRAYQNYHEQLELYAQNEEIDYKPFHILKIVKENGEEEIPTQSASEIFAFVSDDEYLVLDLTRDGYYVAASNYFSTLTSIKKMEGVVIKPERTIEGVAPYMKVRNENYLTIIYGYDYRFPYRYARLMKQKDIRNKLKTSITYISLLKIFD